METIKIPGAKKDAGVSSKDVGRKLYNVLNEEEEGEGDG